MKPAPFDYIRAGSVDESLDALHELGDEARILAGGQSLAAMLNMRLVRPTALIDISGLRELDRAETRDDAIEVGAACTQAALSHRLSREGRHPLLEAALPHVGHYQTRSRGTVCGSIAHADPSAELPLCLMALGGEVLLRSRQKRRRVPAEAFFLGVISTACAPDEMIEAVRFPLPQPGYGYAFDEVSRRHGDFALAAFAAIAGPRTIRMAVGGVADRPVSREWPMLEGAALDDALNAFAWELRGQDDQHATAAYRRGLVRKVGRRVIEEAMRCRG